MQNEFDTNEEDGGTATPANDQPSWMTEETDPSAAYEAALDPTQRFRFLTTNGNYDVAVVDNQPMTLAAALTASGLRYNNASVFEMDGASITLETLLQPGATVVAINSVKGG